MEYPDFFSDRNIYNEPSLSFTEFEQRGDQFQQFHQLLPLAGLHNLLDVGDGDTDQEVHDDETEDEDEGYEDEVGRAGELLESVNLRYLPRPSCLVKREGEILISGVVEVGVVDLSEHHH